MQIAEPLQQIGGESPRVVTGIDHRFHRAEQRRGIPGGERVDGVVDQRHVGGTQQAQRPLVGHPVTLGTGQQLIQHRERVTGEPPPARITSGYTASSTTTPSWSQIRSINARMVRGGNSRNG